MPTRRTFITGAAATALITGCGGRPPRELAGSPADIPLLEDRLAAERLEIAVLEGSLPGLTGQAARLARVMLDHDREHAGSLAQAIRELGGSPPAAEPQQQAGRADPAALAALKQRVAGGYLAAIPKVVNGRLRATFGAIMTTEAEHAQALAEMA
jgi:hypothetical protein